MFGGPTTRAVAVVAAFALATTATAQQDAKLTTMTTFDLDDKTGVVQVGALNLTTGVNQPFSAIVLPQSSDCEYAPLVGAEGQGTATFHTNRSYFFLTQQVCGADKRINQTLLVNTRIPMYSDGEDLFYNDSFAPEMVTTATDASNASVVHSYNESYSFPLASWQLVWDHACNLIVTAPRLVGTDDKKNSKEAVFESWMISEFDGQARYQTNLLSQPLDGTTTQQQLWAKANGPAALDTYNVNVGGPYEWNCGANCTLYTLEAPEPSDSSRAPSKVNAAGPSHIVGRNFHTGEVLSNISSTVELKNLVAPSAAWGFGSDYGNYYGFLMFGLAKCCRDEWCNQDTVCRQAPPGAAVLVGYGGAGKGRTSFTPLITVSAADDEDTFRLGPVVIQGPMGDYSLTEAGLVAQNGDPTQYNVMVYADGVIKNYLIQSEHPGDSGDELKWTATLQTQSPVVATPIPDAWTIGAMSF